MKYDVNVPSSDNVRFGGKVTVEGEFGRFDIACSVPGCDYRSRAEWYQRAQEKATAHASAHQFGVDVTGFGE